MDTLSSAASFEVLLDSNRIAARVRELGEEISRDYQGRTPHLIGILKGAWVFMADLRPQSVPGGYGRFLGGSRAMAPEPDRRVR